MRSVLEDIEQDIDLASVESERLELERTLRVCQEIIHLIAEGIVEPESIENGEDYRLYVSGEYSYAPCEV